MMTLPPRRHLRMAGVLAVLLLLLIPAGVTAHAELVSTTPEDDVTVEGTPTEIVAAFSAPLEVDGSRLSLRDAAGDEVVRGGLDPEDATRLVIVDPPDLVPGVYTVRWTAATDDGHIERGTWSFTVVPPPTPEPTPEPTPSAEPSATAAPTPEPTETPTAAPTPSAAPSDGPGPDDGASDVGADVLLPIVAGLAIVGVAGGFLMSRRSRA
jgi:copper resistance protein C